MGSHVATRDVNGIEVCTSTSQKTSREWMHEAEPFPYRASGSLHDSHWRAPTTHGLQWLVAGEHRTNHAGQRIQSELRFTTHWTEAKELEQNKDESIPSEHG
jgi:hypothetical protein